eukprot:scaffold74355_cov49-Phaeocystis_antarctica.AAC.3
MGARRNDGAFVRSECVPAVCLIRSARAVFPPASSQLFIWIESAPRARCDEPADDARAAEGDAGGAGGVRQGVARAEEGYPSGRHGADDSRAEAAGTHRCVDMSGHGVRQPVPEPCRVPAACAPHAPAAQGRLPPPPARRRLDV